MLFLEGFPNAFCCHSFFLHVDELIIEKVFDKKIEGSSFLPCANVKSNNIRWIWLHLLSND